MSCIKKDYFGESTANTIVERIALSLQLLFADSAINGHSIRVVSPALKFWPSGFRLPDWLVYVCVAWIWFVRIDGGRSPFQRLCNPEQSAIRRRYTRYLRNWSRSQYDCDVSVAQPNWWPGSVIDRWCCGLTATRWVLGTRLPRLKYPDGSEIRVCPLRNLWTDSSKRSQERSKVTGTIQ